MISSNETAVPMLDDVLLYVEMVDIENFEHPNEETPDGSSISDFWDDMHAGFWCDDELNDEDMPYDFDTIPY